MKEEKLPKAKYSGVLSIGEVDIPCHVLEIEGKIERILSTRGVMKSLGRRWRGRKYSGTQLPVFIEAKNLLPYISNELAMVLTPVKFQPKTGYTSEGYRAEILPVVCDIYLRAREDSVLTPTQEPIAQTCEILVRILSKIGIIALVDEATGYQEIRDRIALQKILDKYLTDEWGKWTKTFPDEYYIELFRLRGIPYPPVSMKRPQYVGHWTNDVVYSRLAPGVLKTLKDKNPRELETGQRKRRHHQYFTRDYGHPALKEHLSNLIFLMRSCTNWDDFKRRINRSAPRYGDTIAIDFPESDN